MALCLGLQVLQESGAMLGYLRKHPAIASLRDGLHRKFENLKLSLIKIFRFSSTQGSL